MTFGANGGPSHTTPPTQETTMDPILRHAAAHIHPADAIGMTDLTPLARACA